MTAHKYDHLALAQRDPIEVARFVGFLRREMTGGGGGLRHLRVEHEHDDSCCRREPWAATFVVMLAQAQQPAATLDDGMPRLPGGSRSRTRR